jgi:thiamine-phosphate pyrophosphorylase
LSPEPDPRQEAAHRARPSIVCYVTDSRSLASTSDLLSSICGAVDCGADWIQIREKHLPARELLSLTRNALAAASSTSSISAASPRVFVNDRLDVALASGAAGVHLGGESISIASTVEWCRNGNAPADFAIGLSCHSLDEARTAERAGASYIFFGPVFDTPSKRNFGVPQGLDCLSEVCAAVKIRVIAIGGVNKENAVSCINAGAAGIAAIRMFQESTDAAALRSFIANFHAL